MQFRGFVRRAGLANGAIWSAKIWKAARKSRRVVAGEWRVEKGLHCGTCWRSANDAGIRQGPLPIWPRVERRTIKLPPARLVSPGVILRRELDARGWTQRDLAHILGRTAQAISEIAQGAKRITAETALELAAALGTSAEVWLQLDASYRLRLAEERPETAAVRRAIVKRCRARAGVPPPSRRSGSR